MFENEHIGPGVYTKATVMDDKGFNSPNLAAFGSSDDRKLDNTEVGVIPNPGPGAYLISETKLTGLMVADTKPNAVFASANVRKDNYGTDPKVPCPTAYNT